MPNRMRAALAALSLATLTLAPATAARAQMWVSYTYAGTPGDWRLDFTVHNDIPASFGMNGAFWGTNVADGTGVAAPFPWLKSVGPWTALGTSYEHSWIGPDPADFTTLTPGTSLGGFLLHSAAQAAPATVSWFAYALNRANTLPVPGNVVPDRPHNPLFLGEATGTFVGAPAATVPEPATWALLAAGLLALVPAALARLAFRRAT